MNSIVSGIHGYSCYQLFYRENRKLVCLFVHPARYICVNISSGSQLWEYESSGTLRNMQLKMSTLWRKFWIRSLCVAFIFCSWLLNWLSSYRKIITALLCHTTPSGGFRNSETDVTASTIFPVGIVLLMTSQLYRTVN